MITYRTGKFSKVIVLVLKDFFAMMPDHTHQISPFFFDVGYFFCSDHTPIICIFCFELRFRDFFFCNDHAPR